VTAETNDKRTIVVGYDGREPAERALDAAIDDVRENGGRVVAVVVGQLAITTDPYGLGGIGYEQVPLITEDGPPEIQPLIAAARERLQAGGVDGDAEWGLGDPAAEIVRVAKESNAVRIVVGHHHHSAIGKLFGTDVDARIQAEAGCEVVVLS
jgi:nucleotide-binding universal stress UspA family protein